MSDGLRFGMALLGSSVVTFLACPPAIRVAARLGMYDRPVGWKSHGSPTPYLGGAAVLLGFGLSAIVTGGGTSTFAAVLGAALFLWAVGTLDDRFSLGPVPRVASEVAAAFSLWAFGLGWELLESDAANLALTIVWTLGLVNGTNLLDLMDGVAGSVAAACALGIGLVAAVQDAPVLAALAFSLSGACVGFLPYNLARPSRIFLGDGGSMLIGLVLAAATMSLPTQETLGDAALLPAILLFGVPFLDLAHRVNSRLQRGVSLLTPGPDSIANWLRARLPSPQAVSMALGGIQVLVSVLALIAVQLGRGPVVVTSGLCLLVGMGIVSLLNLTSSDVR